MLGSGLRSFCTGFLNVVLIILLRYNVYIGYFYTGKIVCKYSVLFM